jgi:hydrogenase maturation protein HypF
MELEWLAGDHIDAGEPAYPWECTGDAIDTRPLIRAVAEDVRRWIDGRHIAQRFHATMAELIVAVCARIRKKSNVDVVVLSGGVFMNALLTRETRRRLRDAGFAVYCQNKVPANDGGLSLGQLAVAAASLRRP